MTELAMVLASIFVSFLCGYFIGCNKVVNDIRRMTKELNKGNNDEMSKM